MAGAAPACHTLLVPSRLAQMVLLPDGVRQFDHPTTSVIAQVFSRALICSGQKIARELAEILPLE